MPPWIWMLSAAAWKKVSEQYALASAAASRKSGSLAAAMNSALQAALFAISTLTSISAHLCLIA
jgi:hypothetical protein